MKEIILCADDYGLNASVSQGIIQLLAQNRLSAVSCLTTFTGWKEQAAWLKKYQDQVALGLHFNLTEGKALSLAYQSRYGKNFSPLPRVMVRAFLRKWEITVLAQECQAQLDAFVAALGRLPDFIDGHLHIHQLPQVREAVLRVYERSLRGKNAYLRSVSNMVKSLDWGSQLKQAIIYCCGAAAFQRRLKKQAVPHNTAFGGIYAFPQAADYGRILPYFLKQISNKGLIMCHPGLDQNQGPQDLIAAARFHEYRYLSSEQFVADCQSAGVRLAKTV
ncbi:MAG TPA: ChbG/HpnK family deacetylase [Gammaproteobacteria bacterium]|nr:ChbG/HpnK family deacetylase [Gammaproteobacteria bacterium]